MKTLGQRLRELREEHDLSLRELGKRLEKSAAFLSDVELGRRFPSDRVLAQMAQALGVSEDDLRSFDTRAPVEELKRLAEDEPAFGLALRRIVDREVSAEELLKLANRKHGKKEGGKQ